MRIVPLSMRSHRIEARSKIGNAQLMSQFKIVKERCATLDYWYEDGNQGSSGVSKSLTFNLYDHPVLMR